MQMQYERIIAVFTRPSTQCSRLCQLRPLRHILYVTTAVREVLQLVQQLLSATNCSNTIIDISFSIVKCETFFHLNVPKVIFVIGIDICINSNDIDRYTNSNGIDKYINENGFDMVYGASRWMKCFSSRTTTVFIPVADGRKSTSQYH